MKTCLFLIISILWGFVANSQLYYLTGRPFSFERNNAIVEVGKVWGIEIRYAGSDVLDDAGMDEINKHNDSITKRIAKDSKFGNDWLTVFYRQVDVEEGIHQLIRTTLNGANCCLALKNSNKEFYILIHRPKINRNKLIAYILEPMPNENPAMVHCVQSYNKKGRKKKCCFQNVQQDKLPYGVPQNGIFH